MTDKKQVHDMLRLTTIKRWAIVPMYREQSVAEHVYRVYILVRDLLQVMEDIPHNSFEAAATQFWAIVHDMEEVFTGDIPTTVKQVLEKLSPGITKRLKDEVLTQHLPALRSTTRGVENTLIAYYVKIAEIIEQKLWLRQYAIDSRQAIRVDNSLTEQLSQILEAGASAYKSIPFQTRARAWARDIMEEEEWPEIQPLAPP